MGPRLGRLQCLVPFPALLLRSCVTLGMLLNLPGPHCPHLQNGNHRSDVRQYKMCVGQVLSKY